MGDPDILRAPQWDGEVLPAHQPVECPGGRPQIVHVPRPHHGGDSRVEAGTCSAVLGSKRNFEIETLGSDVFSTSRFVTGPLDHAVTYRGDIFKDDVQSNDPGGTGDEFTPGGERTVCGSFIQDEIDIGGLVQIVGSVRYDAYDLKPSQQEANLLTDDGEVETATDNKGNHVSPKITVGITLTQGLQFFGTYAQGYRAPAITEAFNAGTHDVAFPFGFLTNPDLEAETAETYEVGVNVQLRDKLLPGDVFYGKFVYFENTVDNFIEAVIFPSDVTPILNFPPPPAPPIPVFGGSIFDDCPQAEFPLCFQYQNVERAFISGIELESTYDAGFMFTRIAYSRIHGQDEEINVPLLSVNPDKFASTLGFRFLDETLVVGGRWTHVWAQNEVPPFDRTGGLIDPSETFDLVDLFALCEYSEKYSFAANLNNLFDADYTKHRQFDPDRASAPRSRAR